MNRYYKLFAFIKRDFIILTSYKMAFILAIIGTVFPILSYFFIGELMDNDKYEGLIKYGGNYFSFALIGIAFTSYLTLAIKEFSGSMRRAQMVGCLEAIMSTKIDPKAMVFMSAMFSFVFSGILLIFMFMISWFFLDFNFSNINIFSTLIAVFLSLTTFISLGIISGAGTILFKQGEPFGFVFSTLSSLLAGAVFPIEVMPNWLIKLSYLIPLRYSLDALRLSILQGYTIKMLAANLFILLGVTVILFPLSLLFFNWAVEKGKRDGTLMQY